MVASICFRSEDTVRPGGAGVVTCRAHIRRNDPPVSAPREAEAGMARRLRSD